MASNAGLAARAVAVPAGELAPLSVLIAFSLIVLRYSEMR